jgi:hypothetical protein
MSHAEVPESPSLPSNDDFYELLSDRRRRYALHYLKQREEEQVGVGDIAEQVAAWENGKSIEALTSQERKRVYISLYQSHLPRLDEEGLVVYDKPGGTVELTDALDDVVLYLEVVPRESIPWSTYYAGLTLANALVLLLAWLAVPPFDALPDLAWALVVLVSFGVSAFVQLTRSRETQLGDEGPPPGLVDGSEEEESPAEQADDDTTAKVSDGELDDGELDDGELGDGELGDGELGDGELDDETEG